MGEGARGAVWRAACLRTAIVGLTLVAALGAVSPRPADADETCPNEAIRRQQQTTYLPDCMALEMVSPPQKGGQPAFEPSFSEDGERVLYRSIATLGDSQSLVSPLGDLYVASRTADGWGTGATTAPASFGFGFRFTDGRRQFTSDFGHWFSLEATQSQFLAGRMTAFEGALDGDWGPRSELLEPLDDPGGTHEAEFVVARSSLQGASANLSYLAFNSGRIETRYLPGDPQPVPFSIGGIAESEGAKFGGNTYLLHDGSTGVPSLELLSRDSSGKVWGGNCGAWLGGGGLRVVDTPANGRRNQGAIAADGSRIYFSTRPEQEPINLAEPTKPACDLTKPIRIMVREETTAGPRIEELLPAPPGTPGSDFFEGASLDGSKVYFTSSRPLASTDHDPTVEECNTEYEPPLVENKGCDLYLYERTPGGGHQVIQVSAGGTGDPTPGEGADVVKGVTAISGDGSHVYFVAHGVLTTDPNPEGRVAVGGKLNLYAYERDAAYPAGRTSFVGELDPTCVSIKSLPAPAGAGEDDCHTLAGQAFSYSSAAVAVPMLGKGPAGEEVGGDGHVLVFASMAQLTANDVDGRHRDVYRYDADASPPTLECVSCRPGGPDAEPFDVERRPAQTLPGPEFAENQRWVSEDGDAIVFGTAEPLVAGDTDGVENPYLWMRGALTRLPAARRKRAGVNSSGEPLQSRAIPAAVSGDGSEVAFSTSTALLPQDQDTAEDVYVARSDGGFPFSSAPPPACIGSEQCQGPPAPPVGPAGSGTASYVGNGNAQPTKPKKHKKKKHKNKRHKKKHKPNNHKKRGGHQRGGTK